MKVAIPDWAEEEAHLYCTVFRAGYRMVRGLSVEPGVDRLLCPPAYDAGTKQAMDEIRRYNRPRRTRKQKQAS